MSLNTLTHKIVTKQARLAVIGLGYVGLPVAALFAEAGFDVLGIEVKHDRVEMINAGLSPIDAEEPGLVELLKKVAASGQLSATNDYASLTERDIILIAVETPVGMDHAPDYAALRSALVDLGPVITPGKLVIVESTLAPRTMNEMVKPILEEGSGLRANIDFYLGNCPERVMPGKLLANLRTLSRVIGGGTPETAEVMRELYRYIVQGELDLVDWLTAELVKTVENTYRDVQIAFANEVALICESVGGDVWKVRELVNKTPYRQMHLPGAGVGGHCIPKDPWLLAYATHNTETPLRLILAARQVNDQMPLHVVDVLQQALAEAACSLVGAHILVMGYAYLENSDDARNSPSEKLVKRLKELHAEVIIHDPHIAEYKGDLLKKATGCDAAVIMVRHREYLDLDFTVLRHTLRHPVLLDGRNVVNPKTAKRRGFVFRSLGRGQD